LETDEIRAGVRAAIDLVAPGTDWQRIEPGQPLREQVDFDSLDWMNFIAEVGARLSIHIRASDYAQLESLDSLVAYLAAASAQPAVPPGSSALSGASALSRQQFVLNGTSVTVRPISREDQELEADFVRHLSTEARYKRFMVTLRELPAAKLKYLTDVDQIGHVALVAVTQRDGGTVLLGVVRYVVDATGTNCEFAIAIDDTWQGSGLAGILMHALMGIARGRGIKTMEGIVLANNARMIKFTRQLGFHGTRDPQEREVLRVTRSL
jgi:acetyltransferase